MTWEEELASDIIYEAMRQIMTDDIDYISSMVNDYELFHQICARIMTNRIVEREWGLFNAIRIGRTVERLLRENQEFYHGSSWTERYRKIPPM